MKWSSVLVESEELGPAVEEAVGALCAELGGRPDLVVAFASPALCLARPELAGLLAARLPGAVIVGGSGGGIIGAGREVEVSPALSLTGAVLPGVRITPFHLDMSRLPEPEAGAAAWQEALGIGPQEQPYFLLVADPFTLDAEALVEGLDRAWPQALKVGGLASGSREPGGHRLLLGERMLRSGVVGVALSGNLVMHAVVAQGCRPIGTPMLVTRCEENVVLRLNERVPVEVLRELHASLEPREQARMRSSLFLGIEMRQDQVEYQAGDFLIRNLVGVDGDTGALAVGAMMRPYQAVQFHLRDGRTAAEDLEARLRRYREQHLEAGPLRGALLFSCLGRGQHLYGKPDHDSSLLRELLGQVPVGGFFCNGEIGPVGGTTFLHGYTSAFALFHELPVSTGQALP